MNSDTILVCFYKNKTLPSWLVRKGTQREGQAFSDVPSHCSILAGDNVYEFTSTGFSERTWNKDDTAWCKSVSLSSPGTSAAFAKSCVKIKYDWFTIVDISLCRILPNRWLSWYRLKAKNICSWFCLAYIRRGGYNVPDYINIQIDPVSPNDLWFMLKQYPNGSIKK